MAFEKRRDILIQTFLCSLFSVFLASHGRESDIYCLRSIKESLEDPFDFLSSSWNFNNKTEGFICSFSGVECWHSDENRVLNLRLSNMGLKGQFPRGLQNCSSLTGVDLSFNKLSGPIPSDISNLLTFATVIDLSHNSFTGEIPEDIANCRYLNALRLENNMLSGQIPPVLWLLSRIRTFNVSNNHLSGPVPVFYGGKVFADSYANNDGLCGGPLAPCSQIAATSEFHQSLKNGLIVGYAFSVTSVIVASMFFCREPWTQLKHTKQHLRNKGKEMGRCICSVTRRKMRIVANQMRELLPPQLLEKGSEEFSVPLERLTSTMTLEELSDVTDCFTMDNAIGVGKMGIMYKGRLPNGWSLAVKRLLDSQLFKRQFLSEIMILREHRHRNIIPLLGFCIERNERMLVYQYMSNGRLSKWLHPLESEVIRLKWPERVNIALGVARGLAWLHHSCNLHIVHLNICSECILLDQDFEPKISNFGEAKFMNPNIEDDLGMGFHGNDGKKDVYDFGSLLFELITGKTFNEVSCSSSTSNLSGNPSNFFDAIDKSLLGKGFENEVFTLIKVACECVQPFPDQRPTMLEVYNNLSNRWEGRHRFSDDSDSSRPSEIVPATSMDEIVNL